MADLAPGTVLANGHLYMTGPKGELVPIEAVKPKDRFSDDTARDLFAQAQVVAAELKAFKERMFATVDAYCALLDEKYGVKGGGPKGNMSIFSFDGLIKVVVQVQDRLTFGDTIHQAKALIDEYLAELVTDAGPEVRVIIQDAFRTDKEGQLNRYAIIALRRYNFTDPRWVRAMEAITDAEVFQTSARYIRFYSKPDPQAEWVSLSLNLATA